MRSKDQLRLGISLLNSKHVFGGKGDLCIEMAVDWEELNGTCDELLRPPDFKRRYQDTWFIPVKTDSSSLRPLRRSIRP